MSFEDYREVDGVRLPFTIRSKSIVDMIGTMTTRYELAETQLDAHAAGH